MGVFIGIDPGKKGGMALVTDEGRAGHCTPLPEIHELVMLLNEYRPEVERAYVEKAQAMPGQGVSSMFNYGAGYGQLLGVLAALKIPYDLVTPRTWQRVMISSAKKGESKKEAHRVAARLFPDVRFVPPRCSKPHDGLIDALLIAEYGRRQHVGG